MLLLKNKNNTEKITCLTLYLPCSAGQGPLPEAPNSHPGRFPLTPPAGNMGRSPDCQGWVFWVCSVLQTDLLVWMPKKSSPVPSCVPGNKLRTTDKAIITGTPRKSGAPDSGLCIIRKAFFKWSHSSLCLGPLNCGFGFFWGYAFCLFKLGK